LFLLLYSSHKNDIWLFLLLYSSHKNDIWLFLLLYSSDHKNEVCLCDCAMTWLHPLSKELTERLKSVPITKPAAAATNPNRSKRSLVWRLFLILTTCNGLDSVTIAIKGTKPRDYSTWPAWKKKKWDWQHSATPHDKASTETFRAYIVE